eukprot:scaffold95526_cov63-Phaeocystis_antarctica.AAC.6
MQLPSKRAHGEDAGLAIRALGLEPLSQKLDAQRIEVMVHALAAAVRCVLPWAHAPPFLEAVSVDPRGGAVARARLQKRAVGYALEAHPAPLLVLG